MNSATGGEYTLELRAAANAPGGWQSIRRHYREAVTARRFRPLARRRARTCRPFLVAMRTRNP